MALPCIFDRRFRDLTWLLPSSLECIYNWRNFKQKQHQFLLYSISWDCIKNPSSTLTQSWVWILSLAPWPQAYFIFLHFLVYEMEMIHTTSLYGVSGSAKSTLMPTEHSAYSWSCRKPSISAALPLFSKPWLSDELREVVKDKPCHQGHTAAMRWNWMFLSTPNPWIKS